MDAILIKSRYKVTNILHVEEDYAAFQAVDIESREKTELLLNIYEGDRLRQYLKCFDRLKHCPEFVGMSVAGDGLAAIFSYRDGESIDEVFYKGAELDWRTRVDYAQLMFHRALEMADYPPEISCAGLLSENILIMKREGRVWLNFVVMPMEGCCERELALLLTDQIKKILMPRFDSSDSELSLLSELESGGLKTIAAIYSRWLKAKPEIESELEELDKKAFLQRWLYLIFKNLKRRVGRMSKRKGGAA